MSSFDNNILDNNTEDFDFDGLLEYDEFALQEFEENSNLNFGDQPQPEGNSNSTNKNQLQNNDYLSIFDPKTTSSNNHKHTRDELKEFLDDETIDALTVFGECEEKDILKVMRLGSLDRIIASSVVARRSSNDILIQQYKAPTISPIDHEENAKRVVDKFIKALTNNDMNGLAKLISEDFDDSCFVTTPDLSEPAVRKSRVMMYFGLLFETFPDGLWRIISKSFSMSTMTITYTFSGTSVFEQSIDALFKYINLHIIKRIDSPEDQKEAEDCEFVLSRMSDYVRLPSLPLSPQVTIRHVGEHIEVDANIPQLALSTGQTTNHSVGSDDDSANDDGMIHINSFSKVRINSIKVKDVASSSFSKVSSSSTPRSTLSATGADPSIRALANKALKQGSVKLNRRMDLVFNDMDQIVRIAIY